MTSPLKSIESYKQRIDHTLLANTLLMDDTEVGKLMRSIAEYVTLGVVPSFTKSERVSEMAFTGFKVSNDAYNSQYIASCRLKSEKKKQEWAERKKKE